MKTTTTTTQIPVTAPITENYSNTSMAQEGWKCPQCGAVMAPWATVCVNCRGTQAPPTVVTPSVWWQTQMPNITCEYTTAQLPNSTTKTIALNQEQIIKNTLTENLKKFQG